MIIEGENDHAKHPPPHTDTHRLRLIENYHDEPKIVVSETELMQDVCILNCERVVVEVKGKFAYVFCLKPLA